MIGVLQKLPLRRVCLSSGIRIVVIKVVGWMTKRVSTYDGFE